MRWKLTRGQSTEYTCCFCCHVRVGTMLLGIFNLLLDVLAVTVVFTLAVRPDLVQQESDFVSSYLGLSDERNLSSLDGVTQNNNSMWIMRNNWDCDDKFVGIVLTIGSSLFTISLLYGTITGQPRHLLPFFCLQVFDFCISSLTIIGYFSYEPDVKKWISMQRMFPLRDQLLHVNNDCLLMMAALAAVAVLWIKAYCISVVWSCYKYLVQSQALAAGGGPMAVIQFNGGEDAVRDLSDVQMMMPPKYEDIIQVPMVVTHDSLAPPPYETLQTMEDPTTRTN